MFDPYRKWLGIPPRDMPPNYYRLLGLEVFEEDLDVIEGAADRAMHFVRQYQSGEHAAVAARILNELAIARLCLLKPATKSTYDAKLRLEMTPPEPEVPDLSDAEFQDVESAPQRKTKRRARPSKSALSPQVKIGGGVGAFACVLLVVFLLSGRGNRPVRVPDETISQSARTPSVTPETAATPTTNSSPPLTKPPVTEVAAPVPTDEFSWVPDKLGMDPVGDPVDLLKKVDLSRDVGAGKLTPADSGLMGDKHSWFYLPGVLPEDYQLRVTARRLDPNETILVGFMMGGRQGTIVVDGWGGTHSGLYIDGREPHSNFTNRDGPQFREGKASTIALTVHPRKLHVAFDEKTLFEFHGDPRRLSPGMACRESAFIGLSGTRYIVESVVMIPIQPEPDPVRLSRLKRQIDVFPGFDLKRDTEQGQWTISTTELLADNNECKLYLPTVVPEEYTLSCLAEPMAAGGEYALAIGMVADRASFQFSSDQNQSGLDRIDFRRWNENETTSQGALLKPGHLTRIDCTVTRNEGIRVDADGSTVILWDGDRQRLSIPGDWSTSDSRRLFIGTKRGIRFRDIKLGPPLPAPNLPEHPPFSIGNPVDLLAIVDPTRDAIRGKWHREETALICEGDAVQNALVIRSDIPEEYKLTAHVARAPGGMVNETLFLGLPVGRTKTVLGIDGYSSTTTGLFLDFMDPKDLASSRKGPPVIGPTGVHVLEVEVRKTGIKLTCNGTKILDWVGNHERFHVMRGLETPGPWLSLGSWRQSFRFEKLELEKLSPATVPPAPVLGADGKLMPLINLARDVRRGDWQLDGNRLLSPPIEGCRLRIPVPVPDHYIFSASVERLENSGHLYVGLVIGGNPVSLVVEGLESGTAGIDPLDGRRYFDAANYTGRKYKGPLLVKNKRVTVKCVVLQDTLIVNVGDREIIRWHGDPRRLSSLPEFIPPNTTAEDSTHLWLGAWGPQFAFRDLELKPLSEDEASKLLNEFTGVYPLTSQRDVPLAKASKP